MVHEELDEIILCVALCKEFTCFSVLQNSTSPLSLYPFGTMRGKIFGSCASACCNKSSHCLLPIAHRTLSEPILL